MNARIATVDGFVVRKLFAFDVFRWNLRLGFTLSPRDMKEIRRRRRKRQRSPDLSNHIRKDIGLPPLEESHFDMTDLLYMK